MRINSLSDALGVEILGKAEVRLTFFAFVALVNATTRNLVFEPGGKCQRSCCAEKYAFREYLRCLF